ncbi:MAG TPA: hypothetical protein VFI08_05425, partial [Spirochaetia bacterium]|nr:hypothetical protein [Spirochaetia bacterium]
MHRRLTFSGALALMVLASLPVWAQTTSQFPQSGWVGTTGTNTLGDRDQTVVLFFEIPDTTTGTLYFGINNPGNSANAAEFDEAGTGGTSYWYLIGGTGALSDPTSQLTQYAVYPSTQPLAGTSLSTFTRIAQNESWVYFGGVSPSQGEHIGNKYYFKIVLQADTAVGKNTFQADVSFSNSGSPSGVPGAHSFAFDWSPVMGTNTTNGAGVTWDMFPFVPSGEINSLVVNSWDVDNGYTSSNLTDNLPTSRGALTNGAGAPPAITNSYAIGAATNGTWHLNVVGVNSTTGTANDLAEFWFANSVSGTVYRTYATSIPAQVADHVTSTYNGGTVIADGATTGQVSFQVVDSSGNPQLISKKVWVTLSSGTARISAANATSTGLPAVAALVTTDGNGLGWVKVTDTVSETVTVTPVTNGTNGSDSLPGTNTTASIVFQTDPPPTLSSASNLTFTSGTAPTLPTLSITDSGTANIGTLNGITIRIPASLSANFDTTVTTPTFGGSASAKVSATVSYVGSTVLTITVTSPFLVTDNLTIAGLKFTTTNSASSGSLQLSYDGGGTYPSTDDKVYTVSNPGFTWTAGGGNSNWSNGANWSPAGPPSAGADVSIPNVAPLPVVNAANVTVGNLTIATGASLGTGTFTVTVNSSLTVQGSLNAAGGGSVSVAGNVNFSGGTYTSGAGTFALNGGTSQTLLSNGANFGAMAIQTAGTVVRLQDALTTTSLTMSSSPTLDLNGHAFSTTGAASLIGTVSNAGSAAAFTIGGSTTLTGTTSVSTNGGAAALNAGLTDAGFSLSINAGAGTITINGGGGALNLQTGTLTTTNATASAVLIRNATTVALGNISAAAAGAVLKIGSADVSGAVSQNSNTGISAATVQLNTSGSVSLVPTGTGTNSISNLGASTTSAALSLTTSAGLAVIGAVASGNTAIALNAGVGQAFSSSAAGTINAGTSTVAITANTLALGAAVTGNGGITLIPDANATTVALND